MYTETWYKVGIYRTKSLKNCSKIEVHFLFHCEQSWRSRKVQSSDGIVRAPVVMGTRNMERCLPVCRPARHDVWYVKMAIGLFPEMLESSNPTVLRTGKAGLYQSLYYLGAGLHSWIEELSLLLSGFCFRLERVKRTTDIGVAPRICLNSDRCGGPPISARATTNAVM